MSLVIRALQVIFVFSFMSSHAVAGPMELLSQAAFSLDPRSYACPKVDEERARQSLAIIEAQCEGKPTLASQMTDLKEISERAGDSAEDLFFAQMARQSVEEMKCAESFANSLAKGEASESISMQLELLRKHKRAVIDASSKLAKSTTASSKICPLEMTELKPNPMYQGQRDEYFELCKEIITNRAAVNMLTAAIPLSNFSAVHDLADRYSTIKDGPEFDQLKKEIRAKIQSAYAESAKQLGGEHKRVAQKLKESGGAAFDRRDRYAMMSDPLLVSVAKKKMGADKNAEAFACRVDSRYKSGAEALDAGLTVGSLFLSGGAVVAAKVGSIGFKIAQGARVVRASGAISLQATRIIQASALAVDSAAVYNTWDQKCGERATNFKTNAAHSKNQCVSAPTIESLAADNCYLDVGLSSLGFVGLGASKAVNGAKKASEVSLGFRADKMRPMAPAKYKEMESTLASLRPSAIDVEVLKQKTDLIWQDRTMSFNQKLSGAFKEYTEMRKQAMDASKRKLADESLRDIPDAVLDDEAFYQPVTGKLSVGSKIKAHPIAAEQVVAHELEHLAQYGKSAPDAVEARAAQEMIDKRLSVAKSGPTSLLHAEYEAIGAQWDFLQAVPKEKRMKAAKMVRESSSLDENTKSLLSRHLEYAHLPREGYIRAIAPKQGYGGEVIEEKSAYTGVFVLAAIVTSGSAWIGAGVVGYNYLTGE